MRKTESSSPRLSPRYRHEQMGVSSRLIRIAYKIPPAERVAGVPTYQEYNISMKYFQGANETTFCRVEYLILN